jgi:poly-gamma-glutamate synthesis protein (capsule biosynthesis protein)
VKGKGVDYPFDGGTARVTGHYCCSPSAVKARVPSYVRTGKQGIVRHLVKGADLAIANLENPIPDNPSWHLNGFIFGGEPRSLQGFLDAGIDWVSLANNHVYDYAGLGVLQTRQNLLAAGLKFGGLGKNLNQAGQISYVQAPGVKVAIIACVAVGKAAWASATKSGGFPCKNVYVLPRIAEARRNADMVIVFPHWGIEYNRNPLPSQRKLAAAWVAAGADLILGSHTHVFGAIDDINGHVVIYSMGNFVFDQYWSTATMESAIPEMTFEGTRLVQLRLHPDIILDQAQPNLLNPATDDGRAILKAVRTASTTLDW